MSKQVPATLGGLHWPLNTPLSEYSLRGGIFTTKPHFITTIKINPCCMPMTPDNYNKSDHSEFGLTYCLSKIFSTSLVMLCERVVCANHNKCMCAVARSCSETGSSYPSKKKQEVPVSTMIKLTTLLPGSSMIELICSSRIGFVHETTVHMRLQYSRLRNYSVSSPCPRAVSLQT